jgi:hypothetical protein
MVFNRNRLRDEAGTPRLGGEGGANGEKQE